MNTSSKSSDDDDDDNGGGSGSGGITQGHIGILHFIINSIEKEITL